MIKRMIRYTLLVITLLLAGVWGWSFFYCECLFYDNAKFVYSVQISYGVVDLIRWDAKRDLLEFMPGFPYQEPINGFSGSRRRHPAAVSGRDKLEVTNGRIRKIHFGRQTDAMPTLLNNPKDKLWLLVIPIWLIFVLLLGLMTLAWYRPIRDWRRQRH